MRTVGNKKHTILIPQYGQSLAHGHSHNTWIAAAICSCFDRLHCKSLAVYDFLKTSVFRAKYFRVLSF